MTELTFHTTSPVEKPRNWYDITRSALAIVIGLALARLALHIATGGQYGWHRDELATLDDARYLAWGYVAYPPVTPAIARLALELFGESLRGVRFFSALAQVGVMVLAGLMAREMGGARTAQVMAALATGIAGVSMAMGVQFMYVSFDLLWWVLAAYFILRRLSTDDPRWWLAVGGAIGLGMMTKYTMGVWVIAIVVGVLLTPLRRDLRRAWLWGGVGLSLLIFLPNLVWQMQHDFISLEFLGSIHARDVRIGRTEDFLLEQPLFCINLLTLPLAAAGLVHFFRPAGKRYRVLGWMFVVAFGLFWALQGRSYYLAPAYPMLLAAGSVVWVRWLAARTARQRRIGLGVTWSGLALGALISAAIVLPIFPIQSPMWLVVNDIYDLYREQIGWPELTEQVAALYAALPAEEQAKTGILTGNYGEAGAINLYGPGYGLPTAISGVNSYWLRGYGEPPPETLIVLGHHRDYVMQLFEQCEFAGPVTNRYGVHNEESDWYPGIFVCRGPRTPWPELWPRLRHFG